MPAHRARSILRIPLFVNGRLQILGEQFGFDRRDLDLVRDVVLDLGQRHRVFLAAEADRIAILAGARRASDAMHVVGRILRQVVVEYVADVGNVQAARGDIGRDQHGQIAAVEFAHEAQPLLLRHVARQRLRLEPVREQIALELLRDALGVDEHHRATRIVQAQQADQQRHLFGHRGEIDELAHAVRGDAIGLDPHELGIVHVLVGELQHALRQGRREQHRLARLGFRQPAQNEADIGDEAQVEHAIGLVEHHGLRVAHVEDMLLEVVNDAPGRPDQDIDAVLQGLPLFFVVDATIYNADLETRVFPQHLGVAENLHRQFARGGQNQCANTRGAAPRQGIGQQALKQRHQECGRFAGTRLCLARNVLAGERNRQSDRLDGCGADETCITDAAGDFGNEIERRERQLGKVCLCH